MNYPYNVIHHDFSNLRPKNFCQTYFDILILKLEFLLNFYYEQIFIFQECYFVIQYLGYLSMNLTGNLRRYTKLFCYVVSVLKFSNFVSPKDDYLHLLHYYPFGAFFQESWNCKCPICLECYAIIQPIVWLLLLLCVFYAQKMIFENVSNVTELAFFNEPVQRMWDESFINPPSLFNITKPFISI